MTSSQPPTSGGYGPPPQGGQPGYPPPMPGSQAGPPPAQPPGPPPVPPAGQPQSGPAYGAPPPYGPPPGGAYGAPASTGSGFSFDAKKLRVADYVVVGGLVLYLIMALLPWVDVAHYLGVDLPGVDTTVNGFQFSGLVTFSFVLFLLAAAWAVLPAFTDVKVGFPRAWITVGLAALGMVLTLIAWIRSLSYGFEIWPLIGLLAAVAITLFAFLALLPELHHQSALSGRLAGATQWANQQAPDFPRQFGGAGASTNPPTVAQPTAPPPPPYGPPPAQPPQHGQPPQYGQPTQYGQPPQYGQPAAPSQGAPGPRIPGHGVPEPGIPGQGVPGPNVPGAPGIPPYGPRSGDTQAYGTQPGGSTAAGGATPPTTPGGSPGTPGEDSQRPADPA